MLVCNSSELLLGSMYLGTDDMLLIIGSFPDARSANNGIQVKAKVKFLL